MGAAVVIGAGPGIGLAVARRFARAGLPVAIMARDKEKLAASAEAAGAALAVPVDVTDEVALRAALDTAAAELGPPDVVVYNAAAVRTDTIGELSVAEHARAWAVNVVGAVTVAARVLPGMVTRGSGTFLVTGGVHVATVIVDGAVVPGSAFDPDDIADHYWRLHVQPRAEWEREYRYTGR